MPHALLFDLDGTLIESDTLHREVFAEMFAPLGIVVDLAFYNANIQGRHNPDIFAEFMPAEDPHRLSDEKEARFRALLGTSVPEIPGLTALLDRAAASGWRTAVVTNAPPDNAEFMLAAIGKHGAFDTVVVAADCRASKPDPAPYIEAMARLRTRPEDCVAFEDSRAGLVAARGSGAYVVGLRSSLDDVTLRAAGAHLSITDFNDPALEPALARLKGVAA
jgi:HAD superfamily hydrolase (TIGR01509 family)